MLMGVSGKGAVKRCSLFVVHTFIFISFKNIRKLLDIRSNPCYTDYYD